MKIDLDLSETEAWFYPVAVLLGFWNPLITIGLVLNFWIYCFLIGDN